MIYLKHTTEEQILHIPREGRAVKGRLSFRAFSTINQSGFVDEVEDMETSSLYFKVAITLKNVTPAGEYSYILEDEAGVLSNGILVIGDLESPIEYNKVTEYEQYN